MKQKEEEERKAKEELERKAAEASSSATGQIRASLEKSDSAATTAKLLNSFPVENGPAQRNSYLIEVGVVKAPHCHAKLLGPHVFFDAEGNSNLLRKSNHFLLDAVFALS